MSNDFKIQKPAQTALKKMSSEELSSLSAEMTSIKDKYLFVYKETQTAIHEEIEKKQISEQEERRKNDPDYDSKHQGVGVSKKDA